MNTFYEHLQDSMRFAYRCFDRILLNGLIQSFQRSERAPSTSPRFMSGEYFRNSVFESQGISGAVTTVAAG